MSHKKITNNFRRYELILLNITNELNVPGKRDQKLALETNTKPSRSNIFHSTRIGIDIHNVKGETKKPTNAPQRLLVVRHKNRLKSSRL